MTRINTGAPVAARQPQKGLQIVADRTFPIPTGLMEFDLPRSNVLMRLVPIITYTLTVGGAGISGDLHTSGESALISSKLRGNGDDEIFDLVPAHALRMRSFIKRGQFPFQGGLPADLSGGAGAHTGTVHLPWDFYNKLSATPHLTDLNPIQLSQLIASFVFGSADILYPNKSVGTTLVVTDVRIRIKAEQVLNPQRGKHAVLQQKFVRLGGDNSVEDDTNYINEFPKGLTIENYYMFGLHDVNNNGIFEIVQGVIVDWQWKAQNTIIQEHNEAERRDMIEQDLEEIQNYPVGVIVLESSREDGDIAQSINVTNNSEMKFVLSVVKQTNTTTLENYADINKIVKAVAPAAA